MLSVWTTEGKPDSDTVNNKWAYIFGQLGLRPESYWDCSWRSPYFLSAQKRIPSSRLFSIRSLQRFDLHGLLSFASCGLWPLDPSHSNLYQSKGKRKVMLTHPPKITDYTTPSLYKCAMGLAGQIQLSRRLIPQLRNIVRLYGYIYELAYRNPLRYNYSSMLETV